jgi:hypothetical protein
MRKVVSEVHLSGVIPLCGTSPVHVDVSAGQFFSELKSLTWFDAPLEAIFLE